MQVLLSGGEQGPNPGDKGVLAVLEIYDLDLEKTVHRFEYTPPKHLHHEGQKIQFTGFCWRQDALCVCTHNEILIFDEWPPCKPSLVISNPQFNDLHHCIPWGRGFAIANTGLETVDYISIDGDVLERWDLLRDEPNARRIKAGIDYRLFPDTKPHFRHANHLFVLEGELWVTQLRTCNAICVRAPEMQIDMEVGMPHDGEVHGEEIMFTTTNGNLVFFSTTDRTRTRAIDLNMIPSPYNQLGWCRGIAKAGDDRYLVGFSSVRRSKWTEFGYFLKHGHDLPPSRVSLFDVRQKRLVSEWKIGSRFGFQLFQFGVLARDRSIKSELR